LGGSQVLRLIVVRIFFCWLNIVRMFLTNYLLAHSLQLETNAIDLLARPIWFVHTYSQEFHKIEGLEHYQFHLANSQRRIKLSQFLRLHLA